MMIVGGMKLEDLPGLDALKTPGMTGVNYFLVFFWRLLSTLSVPGQLTKVVREGDNGVVYEWNMKEQKWDKVMHIFHLLNFD